MDQTLLKVENLKTYLRTGNELIKAVDDISFDIKHGETFCLVGESGSGKSITALSLIQLLPKEISSHPSGTISFDYRQSPNHTKHIDMVSAPTSLLREIRGSRISMIFQEPMTSLNPVFTIGEQIIETIQIHNPTMNHAEARKRAIDVLSDVQIANPNRRIDDYPHHLSGGQRQRVMIAMAMACEPDLLIADEPTTALDVTVQKEILQLMQALQARKNMSILFITHDLGVVYNIADRVAVMYQGKIVEIGTRDQVLNQAEHEYTKKLLAALPENLQRNHDRRPNREPSVSLDSDTHNDVIGEASREDVLIDLRQLKIYFPIKLGLFRRTVDNIKAVDGVNLQIKRGKIMALVGESGCGKTTLGRAILRLLEPTGGTILFNGKDITHLKPPEMQVYRQKMQIIFQDPMSSLNPRLTVASTLVEPMAVHGIGESKDERIELASQILTQVQLKPNHLWRYPHEFSGGQKQRIGIARSLVLNPDFIVCDEVTSALDVSVQAEILQMLLTLRDERNLCLLFITHNLGVVEYISDETAVMYRGKLIEKGPTSQICSNPQHDYSKKLLSAVPRLRN